MSPKGITRVAGSKEIRARLTALEDAGIIDPIIDTRTTFDENFPGYMDGIFVEVEIPRLKITFHNDLREDEVADRLDDQASMTYEDAAYRAA